MPSIISQELQPNPSYISGYTFFPSADVQTYISELIPLELAHTLMARSIRMKKTQFIHELWRTGRMEIVYGFFNLPEKIGSIGDKTNPTGNQLTEQDVIDNCKLMMSTGEVGEEECIAFVKDICWASANAHDNQEYREEPQDLTAVVERTMRIMEQVRDTQALI